MKRGEVWIVNLPIKKGKEQIGKRPCIFIADNETEMATIIPLTSNILALRFSNSFEIKKSKENGLDKDSVALIFQIQSLDKKRFLNKIGYLEEEMEEKLNKSIRQFLKI